MNRMTRGQILTEIDDVRLASVHTPIRWVGIDCLTEDGAFYLRDREMVNGRDQTMARLMDLSLTHMLVSVSRRELFNVNHRVLAVKFVLKPSRDYTTNIDAGMLEHIAKMRWEADDETGVKKEVD